jgi:hypothetical protein
VRSTEWAWHTRAYLVSRMSNLIYPQTKTTSSDKCALVFARGTSVLGSNTFTRASEIDVPLQSPGDLDASDDGSSPLDGGSSPLLGAI